MSGDNTQSGVPALDISPDELFTTPRTTTFFLFPKSERFPKGVWVELKNNISYGDSLRVLSALLKGMSMSEATAAAASEAAASQIFTDLGQQKKVRLSVRIKDWNLPGPDGATVKWPARAAERFMVIDELDERVGDWIEARVSELEARSRALQEADPEAPGDHDPLVLLPAVD